MIWIDSERYCITIPQGDTGLFSINVFDSYVNESSDSAIFIVYRKNQFDDTPVIRKELPIINGAVTILLTTEDTINVPAGEYDWDVLLKRKAKFYPVYVEENEETPRIDYRVGIGINPLIHNERHSLLSSINGLPTFRVLEVNE